MSHENNSMEWSLDRRCNTLQENNKQMMRWTKEDQQQARIADERI